MQMPFTKYDGSRDSAKPPRQSHTTEPDLGGRFPQRTILELFATSKQGAKGRETDLLPGGSPNKKLKLDPLSMESASSQVTFKTMGADEMYKFPSQRSRKPSDVIDLTGESQNRSPLKKTPNGLRPNNVTAHTGVRKVLVKNLKASKADPDEYYNRVWAQLDAALTAIFSEDKLPYSMEELYKGVETACRQYRAPPLYDKLCKRCTGHISGEVKESLLQCAESSSNIETLDAVVKAWSRWNKQLEIIRSIFFYLDRSYLLHSSSLPSIAEMGISDFRTHVFMIKQLNQRILHGACDLLRNDRNRDQDARGEALYLDSIKMFHGLAVYTKAFEPMLMVGSEEHFNAWASSNVSSTDLAGYVEGCVNLISEEMIRCDKYSLDQTTKKCLESYLEDILVDQRQDRLLIIEDVGDLLSKDRPDTLAQLFSLLQRRRLGEKLKPAFEAFIIKQGSAIVFDEEKEQEMVIRLLDFKRKLDQIWDHSFQRHEGLGHSLREAFENFINQSKRSNMTWGTDNPKPGEMIAKYVDMVLKGGTKAIRASTAAQEVSSSTALANEDQDGSSEDEDVEIGKQLDQVLDLFRFVHGKAVFEAFYKRDLARRLLLGRSASADSEKSMLTRLKSGKLQSQWLYGIEILIRV